MYRTTTLLVVLLFTALAISACTDNAQPSADAELPDSLAALRPDPNNPVGEELSVPPFWKVRLDEPDPEIQIGSNPDSADIFFVNMTPGWHLTTGPAAIYYHPASTAGGSFRARTGIYLFDPGDRTEAFGLFVGGNFLESDSLSYTYFLIRNGGDFLIKKRHGEETAVLRDWTPHEAILSYTDSTKSAVLNKLAVSVDEREVSFEINDKIVSIFSRSEVATDGIVGLRVNHGLNLHVEDLTVE